MLLISFSIIYDITTISLAWNKLNLCATARSGFSCKTASSSI